MKKGFTCEFTPQGTAQINTIGLDPVELAYTGLNIFCNTTAKELTISADQALILQAMFVNSITTMFKRVEEEEKFDKNMMNFAKDFGMHDKNNELLGFNEIFNEIVSSIIDKIEKEKEEESGDFDDFDIFEERK